MRLLDAVNYFITAKQGEVAPSTVRSLYMRTTSGKHGGRLAHLLNHFGEDRPVCSITAHEMRQWRNCLLSKERIYETHPNRPTRETPYHPRTVLGFVDAAKRLFNWLEAEGLIEENPTRRIKRPPVPEGPPRAIREKDAWAILKTARALARRDLAAWALERGADISYKELRGLTIEDLLLDENVVFVHRSCRAYINGKRHCFKDSTPIPISSGASEALRDWLQIRDQLPGGDVELWRGRVEQLSELTRKGVAYGVRFLAFLEILSSTACRVSEVANLELADLDIDRKTILVRGKGKGGNGKLRYAFLDDAALTALDLWLQTRPDVDSPHLFIDDQGQRVNVRSHQRLISAVADLAGAEGFTNAHAWRHFWAIQALRNGGDLSTVSNVLGHSDIKVTAEFYLRWRFEDLRDRHTKFHWKNQ